MTAVISMLRGVNVGGHHKIKMDVLRDLYETLGLKDARTYVQSGNVVFVANARDHAALAARIEVGIEHAFGFRPSVILRTASEMRDAIARNPFAGRPDIQPNRLAVTFLAADPGEKAREQVRQIPAEVEELYIDARELYIYFPNGMGRPTLSMPALERALRIPGTSRNWNTVTKLLQLAEALEQKHAT